MRIAVITGASSGLGQTYAKEIDKREKKIDEIWLIARREQNLKDLEKELQHPCRTFSIDLTKREALRKLESALHDSPDPVITLFIHCAGYAKIGNYEKVSLYDSANMIDLNCKASVMITLLVLPYMKAGSHIMEICSTAAFQPIPHLNLYAASKAFLYSYTRALRMELLPRGIIVTAVCPWWIKDTNFIATATDNDANHHTKQDIRHFLFATKEVRVVRTSLFANRIGLAVSTPGIMCFLHRLFHKFLPVKILLYLWEIMRRV